MASRFHIEDLISQDSSGVVFRAIDQESGHPVAIRRFFPFGADGGGLQGDEKTAYDISIHRVTHASHPALRTVVTGGCDPIDGVPFVVTEWIEGETLADRLATAPLQSRQAIDVIMRALEVSEVLSQLLAEEAVWVETDVASIIGSSDQPDRNITFWISPLKWLGTNEDRRSLKPIIQLTEDLMGWKNKLVNDQAGGGLASWLKWLKQHANKTTLAEARETLAAATGGQPPPPTSRLVRQSTRPVTARATVAIQPAKKKKSSPAPVILPVAGGLLAIALAGGFLMKDRIPFLAKLSGKTPAGQAAAKDTPLTTADVLAAADAARAKALAETEQPAATSRAASPAATPPPGSPNIYKVSDSAALLKMENQIVSAEGDLKQVHENQDKTQIFLEFEDTSGAFACGFFLKNKAGADMTEAAIKPLIGKKIRIRGKVGIGSSATGKRPKIHLVNRASITEL